MMTHMTRLFAIAFAAVFLYGSHAAAERNPKILIKMATLAGKNSAMADVLKKADREVRERSRRSTWPARGRTGR